MDIVIRTAAGDAEVSVTAPLRDRAVVADVVAAVTGAPCPATVYLNNVAIASEQTLADAGVLAGSTVSTVAPVPTTDAVVTLVQVAGPGAGTTRRLHAGHFRLGPGRRMTAEELSIAPVDRPVATITVRPDGTVEVAGHDARTRVWVEDQPLGDRPLKWGEGMLLAGGRAFLHRPATAHGPDFGGRSTVLATLLREATPGELRGTPVAPDGTLAIPLAVPDAARSGRWVGDAADAGAFEAMLGVRHGTPGAGEVAGPGGSMTGINVALAERGGLGVVGSPEFARGIARSIVLQLTTRHAPSDLRFVVATISEQLRAWGWMKWLPQARGAYGPRIFTTAAELRTWLANARHDAGLTLVLTDDPTWWTGRDAALGALLRQQEATDHPTRSAGSPRTAAITRPIVMTADISLLPSVCTRTVTQRVDDHASIRTPEHGEVTAVPVLPPRWVAADAARRLAPFSDPDSGAARAGTAIDRPSLHDLLGEAAPAWAQRGATLPRWSIPIGLSRVGGWVSLDPVAEGPDVLVAGSGGLAGTGPVAESIVLSAAAMAPPADLAIVLIEVAGRDTFERCGRLPHAVTRLADPSRHEAWRFTRWLDGVLAARHARLADLGVSTIDELDAAPFARLLVALDELVPDDPDLAVFADEVARTVHELGAIGVHLVVGTTRPDVLADHPAARARTRIALRTATTHESELIIGAPDAAGLPRFAQGHAVLRTDESMIAFHPAGFATGNDVVGSSPSTVTASTVTASTAAPSTVTASPAPAPTVTVLPFVIGREPSPLEARLAARAEALPDRSADPYADHLVEIIGSAARPLDLRRRRLRWFAPLPDHLTLEALLEADGELRGGSDRRDQERPAKDQRAKAAVKHEGVPFGLVDLPAEADQRPLRWSPGPQGSVAVLGGTPEESGGTLRTMLWAAASAMSADHLHVYLIGAGWPATAPDPPAIDVTGLPHIGGVIRDESAFVRLTGALVEGITARRAAADGADAPAIAVLIDGLDTFRTALSVRGRRALERLLDALVAGASSGFCAVFSAQRADTWLMTWIDRLGAMQLSFDSEIELDPTGGDRSRFPTLRPGRGVVISPHGVDEFQLATPPIELSPLAEQAMAMAARHRPPPSLDGRDGDPV